MLLKVGITPLIADEMELWQLGAVLGAHEDRTEGIDADLWDRERDSLTERAAVIRSDEPTEEREIDTEVDITAQIARQMGVEFVK
ncbi:MAG: hypothetical protein V3U46_04060 [Acidimicrobiia bacterium]